ncbi:MAG: hypothetical protein ABSE93_00695 [Terriglobia bacterium]
MTLTYSSTGRIETQPARFEAMWPLCAKNADGVFILDLWSRCARRPDEQCPWLLETSRRDFIRELIDPESRH